LLVADPEVSLMAVRVFVVEDSRPMQELVRDLLVEMQFA